MLQRWTIRRASTTDAQTIADFQVAMAAESEGLELDAALVLRGVTEGLADEAKGTYFVAQDDRGVAVGSLLITREWSDWRCAWYWWIQSVYVCPAFRRQGVYRALYAHVKAQASSAGSPCVKLYVDRSNQKGLATYQALGMTESHYLLYEEDL